jgi:hypothetical protein
VKGLKLIVEVETNMDYKKKWNKKVKRESGVLMAYSLMEVGF